jgi:hypothetical protein
MQSGGCFWRLTLTLCRFGAKKGMAWKCVSLLISPDDFGGKDTNNQLEESRMTKVSMSLDVFAKGIACDLGISELSEIELAMIAGVVNGLFGMTINDVQMSAVSSVRRRLPQDAHSRAVLRRLTINGCLRKNDSFSRELRKLISKITDRSGDDRADDVGWVLYWVTQGIVDKPLFRASVEHL